MNPLITFGQANEFGFDVNNAGQLVVMFNRSGVWEIAPITDDALREIQHYGGVGALVETLNKLKRQEVKPLEEQTKEAFKESQIELPKTPEEVKAPQAKKRGRPKK